MYQHFNEAETRYNLIDPPITKAGWNLADRSSACFEVPVVGYDASPVNGITDYCLFRSNGEVLAVVEAKRIRRDARMGKEQLYQYITRVEKKQSFRPFGFLTNGEDIWFWDSMDYPDRVVAGFLTKDDLERLIFYNKTSSYKRHQRCGPYGRRKRRLNELLVDDRRGSRNDETCETKKWLPGFKKTIFLSLCRSGS